MKPELITIRSKIKGVVKAWQLQYPVKTAEHDKIYILKQLKKLNLNICNEKDIADIIGNTSWTSLVCDSCDKKVGALVVVGDSPDYDSRTAWMCKKCLIKAIKLFDTEKSNSSEVNNKE